MTDRLLGVTKPHPTSHRPDRGAPVTRGFRRIARKTEALKRQLLDLNAQIVVTHDPALLRTLLQHYVQAGLSLEQELSDQPAAGPVQTHATPASTAQQIIDAAVGDTPA